MQETKIKSLKEFYPYYLTAHTNITSRILHFTGTGLAMLALITGFMFHNWHFCIPIPIFLYGFSAVGHFIFEKNRPTTFKYPGYTLVCDFKLFYDLLSGSQPFVVKKLV